ncbi:MAG: thymidine phosphorylase, partial [Pseudomonadota bacterium]
TLLDRARAALEGRPGLRFAQRSITRPADAGGEDHEALSEAAFAQRVAEGGFIVHWRAHGLGYGAPAALEDQIAAGRAVVLNGSRQKIAALATERDDLAVVHIDAPEAVVAARLAARGREDAAAIEARRARAALVPVPGVPLFEVSNEAGVEEGVALLVRALNSAADALGCR